MLHFINGARELSRLRAYLLENAGWNLADGGPYHTWVLRDPEYSTDAIKEVWKLCEQIFKSEIIKDVRLIVMRSSADGEYEFEGYPKKVSNDEIKHIMDHLPQKRNLQIAGNSSHEILRVLMLRWLKRLGPTTLTELGDDAGYTYKPVRLAVDKLRLNLFKGSGGYEFKSFPKAAWTKLVMEATTVRETKWFHVDGDQPRSPAAMLDRFYKLSAETTNHVGMGGVTGARGYSDIDLIGLPRLDFTVHCANDEPDLGFLKKLDPALKLTPESSGKCSVAIHLLRRPNAFFDDRLADPVECLLDLHEMRLDQQAREFAISFQPVGGETI